MLLSDADNRQTPSGEVEKLQSRAREFTRQQVEQMDDGDRALYREWTSLVSRNAISSNHSATRTQRIIKSEAQTLMATSIRGYARYLARTTGSRG